MHTLTEVIEVLDSLPAGRTNGGQCHYVTSHYDVDDNIVYTPHCIIAQTLTKLGMELPGDALNNELFGNLTELYLDAEAAFDDSAFYFLADVQREADNGGKGDVPWGTAIMRTKLRRLGVSA